MCRWLTYRGQPIYLDTLIFEPENSLIHQSLHARKTHVTTNGDGFGVGWYGERDIPGIYRDILPAWNDPNLRSLSHQISSRLFFAHVRASTGTATSRANCHPFGHKGWMFMHNGQVGGYDRLRRKLENLVPDELFVHRLGTTDSELFFLMLFANGLERDPVEAINRSLALVQATARAAEVTEAFRMTAALSDGHRLYAIRYASEGNPPSLYWSSEHGNLTVVSEPLDADLHHWNEVPPDHVLAAEAGTLPTAIRFAA
ncbi:MAG: class II glutamine amidotransferase [Proteobacteria bacterium]|nr:class II glutamine amidotransferase [Pseudomonadota bacterium]MBI3496365.1 class II glutamine amidotransferase [Pseudomonadota bacterium]